MIAQAGPEDQPQINRLNPMNFRAIPWMLAMIPSVARGVRLDDLEKIKSLTRAAFPAVKQATTGDLADWMEESRNSILIVDVRSSQEYAVSHLRNAVNLRNFRDVAQSLSNLQPSRAVLYCSVGFRSSWLANQFSGQTREKICNLEGSIFQWANEGRPMFRDQVQVTKVHPYSERWKGLLRAGLPALTV